MTAKEYFEYDQDKIPFKDCSTKDCETYDYDGEEPAYSKSEMIAFADSYHKKHLDLYGVSQRSELLKVLEYTRQIKNNPKDIQLITDKLYVENL